MADISTTNIVDVKDETLAVGQRAIKITTDSGSVVVPVGVGSFMAGGNVYVEAQKKVTDTTSTSVTIPVVKANTRYEFTQPLTSLTIDAVLDSGLESDIVFTAGTGFALKLPSDLAHTIGGLLEGTEVFSYGVSYIISFRYNEAIACKFND